MIKLGHVSEFEMGINELTLGGNNYFFLKTPTQSYLYASTCPHMGGDIEYSASEDKFICPLHNWKFNTVTGQCFQVPGSYLERFPVFEKEGFLFCNLKFNEFQDKGSIVKIDHQKSNIMVTLHSHACLEIRSEDFNLLCDPWVEEFSFQGAWAHYPPSAALANELEPDAIWISHEHSDHMHERSLRKMNLNIPVFVPRFPNERMEEKLKEWGFTTVIAVPFGERVKIGPGFYITLYEPTSLWNDCIVLIEASDFRLLNLNDAGINQKIASKIEPVDVVASSFSPGASGYPLTWTHLSPEEKVKIMERSKKGALHMLKQAKEIYKANYILPFASHFTLWRSEHDKYISAIRKNTVEDVVRYFKCHSPETTVIDLKPGDCWHVNQQYIERSNFYIPPINEYITSLRTKYEVNNAKNSEPSPDDVIKYFHRLNDVPEMAFCEDLTFKVEWALYTLYFRISNKNLTLVEPQDMVDIKMKVPGWLLHHIIQHNESWDEATIGYWCEFSRQPDIYHAHFWRLLQAPYYKKHAFVEQITQGTTIATVLEKKGDLADRVFKRYGLYCVGCSNSVSETIHQGAVAHGLKEEDIDNLIIELNRI